MQEGPHPHQPWPPPSGTGRGPRGCRVRTQGGWGGTQQLPADPRPRTGTKPKGQKTATALLPWGGRQLAHSRLPLTSSATLGKWLDLLELQPIIHNMEKTRVPTPQAYWSSGRRLCKAPGPKQAFGEMVACTGGLVEPGTSSLGPSLLSCSIAAPPTSTDVQSVLKRDSCVHCSCAASCPQLPRHRWGLSWVPIGSGSAGWRTPGAPGMVAGQLGQPVTGSCDWWQTIRPQALPQRQGLAPLPGRRPAPIISFGLLSSPQGRWEEAIHHCLGHPLQRGIHP